MNGQNHANEVRPPAPTELGSDAREQIRDWEFLFWAFLLFGLARLAWLYLYRPPNNAFHLGLSCGFVFCGVLGFLMRWVFSPRRGNNNDARIVRQPAAEPASPGEHGDRRRRRPDGGVLVRLVCGPRSPTPPY